MTAALANGLATIFGMILTILQILIIASVIISWVSADPRNPIVQMINKCTEPMYKPFRILTKKIPGPLDWTPLIVLLLIIFIQNSLVVYLRAYARTKGL